MIGGVTHCHAATLVTPDAAGVVGRTCAVRDGREDAVARVFVRGSFRRVVHAVDDVAEQAARSGVLPVRAVEEFLHAPDDRGIDLAVVVDFLAGHVAVLQRVARVAEAADTERARAGVFGHDVVAVDQQRAAVGHAFADRAGERAAHAADHAPGQPVAVLVVDDVGIERGIELKRLHRELAQRGVRRRERLQRRPVGLADHGARMRTRLASAPAASVKIAFALLFAMITAAAPAFCAFSDLVENSQAPRSDRSGRHAQGAGELPDHRYLRRDGSRLRPGADDRGPERRRARDGYRATLAPRSAPRWPERSPWSLSLVVGVTAKLAPARNSPAVTAVPPLSGWLFLFASR